MKNICSTDTYFKWICMWVTGKDEGSWPEGLNQIEVRELVQVHKSLQGLEVELLPVGQIKGRKLFTLLVGTCHQICLSSSWYLFPFCSPCFAALFISWLLFSSSASSPFPPPRLTFLQEILRWLFCWVPPLCRGTLRSIELFHPAGYSPPGNWCPACKK